MNFTLAIILAIISILLVETQGQDDGEKLTTVNPRVPRQSKTRTSTLTETEIRTETEIKTETTHTKNPGIKYPTPENQDEPPPVKSPVKSRNEATAQRLSQTSRKAFNAICTEEGFASHPEDCTKFIRCVDQSLQEGKHKFVRYDFDCPAGTVFDPSLSICNFPGDGATPSDCEARELPVWPPADPEEVVEKPRAEPPVAPPPHHPPVEPLPTNEEPAPQKTPPVKVPPPAKIPPPSKVPPPAKIPPAPVPIPAASTDVENPPELPAEPPFPTLPPPPVRPPKEPEPPTESPIWPPPFPADPIQDDTGPDQKGGGVYKYVHPKESPDNEQTGDYAYDV